MTELIDLFLDDARRQLDSLREAISQGDVQDLKLIAHGLRGGSGNVGAHQLAALCHEMEAKADDREVVVGTFSKIEREFARVRQALEAARHKL